MTPLDWIGLGFLLVFSLLGLFRGGAWQLRRFLGVLLAMLLARIASPIAAPTIASLVDPTQPRLAVGIGYLLVFLFTLCMLALLFKLLAPAKRARAKSAKKGKEEPTREPKPKHRLAGLGFGVLTAGALYAALITCVLLLDPQGRQRASFASSRSARWTAIAIDSMGEAFPLAARQPSGR